jgi:hypothetical protein
MRGCESQTIFQERGMLEVRRHFIRNQFVALAAALALYAAPAFAQTATPTETPTASPNCNAEQSVSTAEPEAKLQPFQASGEGTITYGATGCETTPGICDVSASGILGSGKKAGLFQANFSVQWSAAVANGSGGLSAGVRNDHVPCFE